jgi:hypothetical protein
MASGVASDPGLVEAWLEAEPEWRLARVFLAQAREPRMEAWCAFEHALRETVWRVRDARVAQAKLGWWLEDIGQARAGAAQHPLLQRLGSLDALDVLDRGGAEGILRGAAHAAAMESPADMESMLAAFVALEQPLAQARARLAGTAVAEVEIVRGLAAARVLCECRHWARFALPERARLPLALLARVGKGRDAALAQGPLLAAALADALLPHIEAALAAGSPSALDTATLLIGRSLAARRPRVAHWRLAFALWRLARHALRA